MNIPTGPYASMFSTRLSSAYNSLRGDLGAPQTASDTIGKLVERIQTSAAIEDRRTAVQGLKGLSRDWKDDVGRAALESLLAVLQHDAPHDVESAKAVLETLMQLCEVAEKPTKDDLGYRHTDTFLSSPTPFHSLLTLISTSTSFYPRFYALQFLSLLLTSRPALAQSYIMSAPPPGVEALLATLDAKAPLPSSAPGSAGTGMGGGAVEMLRNEALLLLPVMLAGNADLQKIVAFSGAFERLVEIIDSEGGIDGGIVVQDALTAVGSLLRFNVSNQNYFRELSLISAIPPMLGFPPSLALDIPAPDAYCLQYWPEQKVLNTGLVLGLVRMLTGGPGGPNQAAMVGSGVTRSLLELALSSNAPSGIKSQILNTLTPILLSSVPNQNLLASMAISPLVPVAADEANPNGGFVRDPVRPAVVALVQSVVEGDPATGGRGLRGRAAGVNMFEAFVNDNDDARIDILSSLSSAPASDSVSAGSIILSGLLDMPPSGEAFDPYRPLFASLLLAHLVRSSEHGKKLARETTIGEDEDSVSLVQLVVGNLMMAAREQTECVNRDARDGRGSAEEEDWTRVMVGYLALLCTWLWDSPRTVREFLSESGNLQVLIQPITQPTGSDPLVQGLSAFLLGVCYEFNREPGEITRTTLHPILHSRIGPDQFVSRMARLREDARFKAVQPDAFEADGEAVEADDADEGLELWFDWAFVDFWKNHYYTIQRSIAIDPDAVRGSAPSADDGETASIIMSLRAKLKTQNEEVMALQSRLSKIEGDHHKEKDTLATEVQALSEQIASLSTALAQTQSTLDERTAHFEQLQKDLVEERSKSASSGTLRTTLESTEKDLATTKTQLDSTRAALKETEAKLGEAEQRVEEAEGESQRQFIRAQAAEADAAAAAARAIATAAGAGKKGKRGRVGMPVGEEEQAGEEESKVEELMKELERLRVEKSERDERDVVEAAVKDKERDNEVQKLRDELKEEKQRASELLKEKENAEAAATAAAAAAAATKEKEKEDDPPTSGKQAKKAAKAAETKLEQERERVIELERELTELRAMKEEHEDLLVLLEEMSEKRRRDRKRLRALGEEGVSESENEEEEGEEDE